MDTDNWTLLSALLPSSFELNAESDSEAVLTNKNKSVKIIYNDKDGSYVVNGTTLHFEDSEAEVVFTLLIPYLLSLFDGEKRI